MSGWPACPEISVQRGQSGDRSESSAPHSLQDIYYVINDRRKRIANQTSFRLGKARVAKGEERERERERGRERERER